MAYYETFYPENNYFLDNNYGNFIGYRVPAGKLGFPMKADTAAQIIQATNALNQGIIPVEIGALSPDVFHQIPKEHFKEIKRLSKLTGAEPTMHAPLIEPSGFVENNWDEMNQRVAEERLKDVVDKSHEMDPSGNIPITIHSSNIPGSQFKRGPKGEYEEEQIVAVNQETGRIETVFREEERYYPNIDLTKKELIKHRIYSPTEQLNIANRSQWINKVNNLATYKKNADEIIDAVQPFVAPVALDKTERISPEKLTLEQKDAFSKLEKANVFLENVETTFQSMFNEAYKLAKQDKNIQAQQELKNISDGWREELRKFESYAKDSVNPISNSLELINLKRKVLDEALIRFNHLAEKDIVPNIYKPIEEFAMQKSSQTLGNVAWHSYDKYGDEAPIISIENLYPGLAFSKPEDFKKLVDLSKAKFVENAVREGIPRGDAKKIADSIIGVTWDVGHLNILRKQGFKEEDLVKATKLIGKDVKHIHLTDNFGYSDSHLAPGMGNVPTKKHLEALEKAGILDKVKMIVEAPGVVQHFGVSPHPYVLESLGSQTGVDSVFWNQAIWNAGAYYSGYGPMNPEGYHSTWGRGFSSPALPLELGAPMPGKEGSRATGGTPLA